MKMFCSVVCSRVRHNHLIVRLRQDAGAATHSVNLGFSDSLSLYLRDDGSHWAVGIEQRVHDAEGAVAYQLGQFRDQKTAQKVYDSVSKALFCPSKSWSSTLWRVAFLSSWGAFFALVTIVFLMTLLTSVSVMGPLAPRVPTAGIIMPGQAPSAQTPQMFLNQASQKKAPLEAPNKGPASSGGVPSAQYGVPLSADEVLGAQ